VPDIPAFGRADSTVSNPLVLFPAANGYRRRLYEGRAFSVQYDHHANNEWGEHSREQEQLSAILNEATVRLKWKPAGGDWRDVKIQGPSVWLIPSGTPHALVCPGEVKMVTLFLEREFTADLKVGAASAVLVVALAQLIVRDAFIGHLAGRFRQMCREPIVHDAAYVESIGRMLSTHLLQALWRSDVLPDQAVGLSAAVLARVVGHIEEHVGDSLRLASLGRVAGLSSSHFGRLFKVSTGLAPHAYVLRRRVAKAEQLLLGTDKKEVEIASLCGFSDETLMARWFRRILQCRPSEIRAQRLS
jgi:AraC family transcriptional regulator